MAIQWDKYHIRLVDKGNKICISRGEKKRNGLTDWTSTSDDRTENAINVVALLFSRKVDPQKHYFGYMINDLGGRLLYIPKGYTFKIIPERK